MVQADPLRRLAENVDAAAVWERTTAIGLAHYAYEFLEAAMVVDETTGGQPGHEHVSPVPAYYLAMHSIELSLKAYLCSCGMTIDKLDKKPYGHNIRKCYLKARELGLRKHFEIVCSDLQAIRMLMKLNAGRAHALRYFKRGEKHYPSWAMVEPLAVRLHQVVASLVGYAKTFDIHYPALHTAATGEAEARPKL